MAPKQNKNHDVGHQQCRNYHRTDKISRTKLSVRDMTESLLDCIEQVQRSFYVEDPHQWDCYSPPQS